MVPHKLPAEPNCFSFFLFNIVRDIEEKNHNDPRSSKPHEDTKDENDQEGIHGQIPEISRRQQSQEKTVRIEATI